MFVPFGFHTKAARREPGLKRPARRPERDGRAERPNFSEAARVANSASAKMVHG